MQCNIIHLPFNEPVIIIALLLAIMLIGPVIFERARLPAIAGLLISGALIGPNGFNLLSPDLEFSLLGTLGLLYLMFLAGLEIDLLDFIENKGKSIIVGLTTFLIPFISGYLIFRYIFNYEFISSWLIAAMLSSHTLISYPLLHRLGIVNKSIVTIVVGATIIADILALVSMEIITNFSESDRQIDGILIMGLQFSAFLLIMLILIPRISRIFLRKYEGDLGVQYTYVLFILFLSALTAFLLEIEPILGAFFSGLVLNRLVISSSPLYKRIEFIGNNLFIPFFLISIGILTNFRVYFGQPVHLVSLFILIVLAFGGKYLAAFLSKILIGTTQKETNLLFGLSVSRAASAIAIILIGFNMGILSELVLNNTVMLILLTSISSSYITQKAGKKILLLDEKTADNSKIRFQQKILVPLANPENMRNMLEFASLMKEEETLVPIFPLTVIKDKTDARSQIDNNFKTIAKVIETLKTDVPFDIISRIDNSVTNGIARASEELTVTTIIIGWNKVNTPFQILFGGILKNMLQKTGQMLIVLKTPSSMGEVRKIQVYCPENAQYEKGFNLWIDSLLILVQRLQIKVQLNSTSAQTLHAVIRYLGKTKASKYFEMNEQKINQKNRKDIPDTPGELVVFIHSRKNSISYDKGYENHMNRTMERIHKNNIVIIYPEQS